MPIPDFAQGGILPIGIHDCNLSEIETRFVYNERRRAIWKNLLSYIAQVATILEVNVMYVDGSYVTDKKLPGDIDVVLEFTNVAALMSARDYAPHLFSHKNVKTTFNIDLFTFEIMPAGRPDFREFFQLLRPQEAIDRGVPVGTKKGILKVSIRP